MSAGWASLMFALFYWVIDVAGWRSWSLPLTVIGVNALAAYLGPGIVSLHRVTDPFFKPFGPVALAGGALALGWLILYWMFRRKIFLRA
jgi:predicted acyltransferase